MNILLIDADVFCYQFAFKNEDVIRWDGDDDEEHVVTSPEIAKAQIDEFVEELAADLKGSQAYFILSDTGLKFREELEPTYNQNRKEKPHLWRELREYVEHGDHGYPVRWLPRLEGDDVLGMMATHPKKGKDAIMVSIDKDMNTVPGRLYLYNKPKEGVRTITRDFAQHFHMTQTLTGDPVDNFKGVHGVGPKKAEAALAGLKGPDLWDAVVDVYESHGMTEEDALLQARLAYILQYGDYKKGKVRLWKPNRLR